MSRAAPGRLIERALTEATLRANSLLITLFGDAIAPHGGEVWLGSLIELVAPLGLSERLVRTSVFRLVREDWISSTPVGRRSLYRLTEAGRQRLQHAYLRVYAAPEKTWNGEWQLAILPEGALAPREREALKKTLLWEGFGALANGIFAHPSGDPEQLRTLIATEGRRDRVVLLAARNLDAFASAPVRRLVGQCWRLDALAADYRGFLGRFRPLARAVEKHGVPTAAECFVLRALLIHEFRRIQLRDPRLPDDLLDADWPGHAARRLCQELYATVFAAAEEHLGRTLWPDAAGQPPAPNLFLRFSPATPA